MLKEIETVVKGLGEIAEDVIFVGGYLPIFYVNVELFEEPRPTFDIDCIIEIKSRIEHYNLEKKLISKGFKNDASMVARWNFKGIIVDIMPTNQKILGFSNKWYKRAFNYRRKELLPNGNNCYILSLPYFIATKFEALNGRADDLRFSKDLEDIIYVINGCETAIEDIKNSDESVKKYISEQFKLLKNNSNLEELIEGNLSRANYSRKKIILKRILEILY